MSEYENQVRDLESRIGGFGFKSSYGQLLDGSSAIEKYSREFETDAGRAKLLGRTPAHLDRDRILYSAAFRRQDDKFHTLIAGTHRRTRNYTTHALRAAHIARAVAARTELNVELAEAIVLGSKVGATSFQHRAVDVVNKWLTEKIKSASEATVTIPKLLRTSRAASVGRDRGNGQAELPLDGSDVADPIGPRWLEDIKSADLLKNISTFVPWASGDLGGIWHSGLQSYWVLTANPYLLESIGGGFLGQTMYGVWRHSLSSYSTSASQFSHEIELGSGANTVTHTIKSQHVTHEAVLGRYCDDVTWVLENLEESSRAAVLAGKSSYYSRLLRANGALFDGDLAVALAQGDSGKLYSYFIDDLVKTTISNMAREVADLVASEIKPLVSLSEQARNILDQIKLFLTSYVFSDSRIELRNQTLDIVLTTALEVLSAGDGEAMFPYMEQTARLDGWDESSILDESKQQCLEPLHRWRLAIDVLASLSDREIYELIGLD